MNKHIVWLIGGRSRLVLGLMVISTSAMVLFAFGTSQAAAPVWWWPPTGGMSVEPPCATPQTEVAITLSGDWGNSCIPNCSVNFEDGSEIDFYVIFAWPPPPHLCLQMITPWSLTESADELRSGTYDVYATAFDVWRGQVEDRTFVGTFAVYDSGDLNCDGGVDLLDFEIFQECFTGPGGGLLPGCQGADFEGDEDVDLADFSQFQLAFAR